MDIKRAFRTAKSWSRGYEDGALWRLLKERMVLDEVHRFRLICEVVCERNWLQKRLGDKEVWTSEGVSYTQEDCVDFENLLEVIINAELGNNLDGYC